MKIPKAAAATIAAIGAGLIGASVQAAPAERPVQADVLVRSDKAWNGKPYESYPAERPQLTVMRMTIAAHSALPWHTHVAPNASYILSGHLTVEDRDSGQKKTFHTGEAFTEQVGAEHRGYTDDEPCTVIITYAGAQSLPTSVPAPGEKPAY